jgi:cellulose synthase/poly-beta-1,6-N-acetylglucosamine synthase-like glycosyltransferase
MLVFFTNGIVFLFGITLLLILLYSLSQGILFFNYIFLKVPNTKFSKDFQPRITIQLPIFNEKYVVSRLLNCISELNYPKEKLQIQVLDDSTDESLTENQTAVKELQSMGFDAQHLHRKDRIYFKAGALKEGLQQAKGDFIVIFDADFLPESDWLNQTLGYFVNPNLGVVQTRWQHLNRHFNIATQVQAMALDHHFTIEQSGRNLGHHFINFNGTAGIWRKSCILDAGNWEGDTLTEDLDLSYRAQLKNWQFLYVEEVATASELPVAMSAIKSQQFRWNKGGAENLIKNAKSVLFQSKLPIFTKMNAMAHLLNSSVFVWVFLLAFLSVPMLVIRKPEFTYSGNILYLGALVKFNFGLLCVMFYVSFRKTQSSQLKKIPSFLIQFFLFFPIVLGLSFHNALAVLEGYLGIKSAFVRTPKFNITSKTDTWRSNHYLIDTKDIKTWIELFLVFYFLGGIYLAFLFDNFSYVAFHIELVVGYAFVSLKTLFKS